MIGYGKGFVCLKHRVQINPVTVRLRQRRRNSLPVRVSGDLSRRYRRPTCKMTAVGWCDGKAFNRIQTESSPVYCRLLSHYFLSVYINDRVRNRQPIRIKSKHFDVFIPIADNGNVQFGIENHFTLTVGLREISGKSISRSDRRNNSVRRQMFTVGNGNRIVDLRTCIGIKGYYRHSPFPNCVKRNIAVVFRAEVGYFCAVAVHYSAVFRKRPTDKSVSRLFKSV